MDERVAKIRSNSCRILGGSPGCFLSRLASHDIMRWLIETLLRMLKKPLSLEKRQVKV